MRHPQYLPAILFAAAIVANLTELPAQTTALDEYIAKPDASYSWKVVHTISQPDLTVLVIDMKSQTWRNPREVNRPLWQHWLVLAIPKDVKSETALLFISGGKNGGDPPRGPEPRTASIAIASRSVVATLMMIPNQPLEFHGDGKSRVEDDLVAYTWDQFLKTGDPTWPARNPMVKSAVRAMDTVTAAMASEAGGRLRVNTFVIAGGSKRGWTTWLTGAVDRRVIGIAPIVIDVLNVEKSMRHHYAAYGFWAPAVHDYVEQRIFEYLDSPKMDKLMQLVDPYCYRERLTMPKFIINASGDQFFLPDSSQFYFDGLRGDKYLCYVPNADHSLEGSDAIQSLLAFYLTVVYQKARPKMAWEFQPNGAIRVTTEAEPQEVALWQATNNKARDFRVETLGKKYQKTSLAQQSDGSYVANVTSPKEGWTAYFVELSFDIGLSVPFKLTTAVRVTPDTLPHQDKNPAASSQ